MKLRMDICDVDVWFEIKNYKKSTKETADYDWCKTSISLEGKYINYHIDGWEIFKNSEIDYIRDVFRDLLEENIKEPCVLNFIEPDIEFVMHPIKTLYSEPGKVIYRNGSITLDISVDFIVHFWCDDGALGSNVFTMTLYREEIAAFYTYLRLVTGEIDKNSDVVGEYANKGYIYMNYR